MIKAIAVETSLTQVDVTKVVNALEAITIKNLENGERTQLTGFLTVAPVYRAARKGFDPVKKEAMDIAPTVGVKVRAGERLKKATGKLKVKDFAPAE